MENNSCYHPKDAPRLFVQNAKVNDFNDRAHRAISGTKYSIKAHDSVIEEIDLYKSKKAVSSVTCCCKNYSQITR